MSIDYLELGRRAVACKGWRWLDGMHAIAPDRLNGCRITPVTPFTLAREWYTLPDLTDPATLGCLLALIRDAWSDPTASTAATRETDGKRGWVIDCWDPQSPLNGIGPFQSEAEALIGALEAAP